MISPDFKDDPQQRDEWHRFVHRALRERSDALPENFAAQTAAFVESAVRGSSDRLESWLQRTLVATLLIAAGVTVYVMGGRALAALSPSPGSGWIYTVALCLGLSIATQHFVRRRESHR